MAATCIESCAFVCPERCLSQVSSPSKGSEWLGLQEQLCFLGLYILPGKLMPVTTSIYLNRWLWHLYLFNQGSELVFVSWESLYPSPGFLCGCQYIDLMSPFIL